MRFALDGETGFGDGTPEYFIDHQMNREFGEFAAFKQALEPRRASVTAILPVIIPYDGGEKPAEPQPIEAVSDYWANMPA